MQVFWMVVWANLQRPTSFALLLPHTPIKAISMRFLISALVVLKLTKRRFYYADERKADGTPAYSKISGEAHGKFYADLAEHKSQGPWQQTFVKDVGYKHFPAA